MCRSRWQVASAVVLLCGAGLHTCSTVAQERIERVAANSQAPYAPSSIIRGVTWAPAESIVRQAKGGDNWPLTWADDDNLYTAYGDVNGFPPRLQQKLSLGLAKVSGSPPDFSGVNL